MDVRQALEQSAPSQHLLSRQQLVALGCEPAAVSRAARAGQVTRVHRGVYGLGPLAPMPEHLVADGAPAVEYVAAARAALLALGPGSAAVSTTAAVLRGWGLLHEPTSVQLAVRHGRGRTALAGVTVRQLRGWEAVPHVARPGTEPLPVTSALTTALHCATRLPLLHAVVAVDSALRSEQVALDQLTSRVARLPGTRRARHAREVLRLCDPQAGSVLESVLRVRMVQAGITGFTSQRVVSRGEEHVLQADFCFEQARLVVEVDGARWHEDRAKDRRTDNALAALGWRVLRYGWAEVVHGHEAVLREVHEALRPESSRSQPCDAA